MKAGAFTVTGNRHVGKPGPRPRNQRHTDRAIDSYRNTRSCCDTIAYRFAIAIPVDQRRAEPDRRRQGNRQNNACKNRELPQMSPARDIESHYPAIYRLKWSKCNRRGPHQAGFLPPIGRWNSAGDCCIERGPRPKEASNRARIRKSPRRHATADGKADMGDVVNLNQFRKRRERDRKVARATENRARHGISTAKHRLTKAEAERRRKELESKRLQRPDSNQDDTDPSA